MFKASQQVRRWFALCLIMMMLVTGLIPAVPTSAAAQGTWTIKNPSDLIVNNGGTGQTTPSEINSFGTQSNPVEVKTRSIKGIVLTNSVANNNTVTVKVQDQVVTFDKPQAFVGNTLTLDKFDIDRNGNVTKVEVTFNDEKITMFYKLEKGSYGTSLTFKANGVEVGRVGDPGNENDPIVVYNSKLSGLEFSYNGGTLDPEPLIEVQVNGVTVQSYSGTLAKPLPATVSLETISLKSSLNMIKVVAVNTGYEKTVVYDYQQVGSAIVLTDYKDQGNSKNNAVIHPENHITLRGVVGTSSGIKPENLRLEISTNNGQNIKDLSSTAPSISGLSFTFYDIELEPGLNEITFYDQVGAKRIEHLHFFVVYNNTPYIDNITVNDTPLGLTTTLITVPSNKRLSLSVDGSVKSADRVVVKNMTTNEEVETKVSSGTFSASISSVLGENRLAFTVYSKNTTVGVITRTIHVVSRDKNTANQLNNVEIIQSIPGPPPSEKSYALDLNKVVTISGSIDANGNTETFRIKGKALLQFENNALQTFKALRLKFSKPGSSFTVEVAPSKADSKGSGFTEYTFDTDIQTKINNATVKAGLFKDGDVYTVSADYVFIQKDNATPPSEVEDYAVINGYEYKFMFTDSNKAQFVKATYDGTKELYEGGVNVLGKSNVGITIQTKNMSNNPSDYKVLYEGKEVTPQVSTNQIYIDMKNLPAGTGTLEIRYSGSNGPVSVTYKLRVEVSPYVHLTYTDGTGQKTFESGYEASSDSDFYTLNGKIYNYQLTNQNIIVRLNNVDIVELDDDNNDSQDDNDGIGDGKVGGLKINPSTASNPVGSISIPASAIREIINARGQGEHELEIKLTTDPSVSLTYSILYMSSKAPTINDIKLEIIENGKTTELTKKATDTAYQTSAKFLSGFSFKVEDGAEHVYIEKSGKRIADFRYENGDWELQENNQDYINTIRDIPSDLQDDFESLNFEAQSRILFDAKMKSREYGDLIESVQDELSKAEEQENVLALFPLTLKKNGSTTYTIVAEDSKGAVVRYNLTINQTTNSWEVISPVKAKESDQYIVVNSNSVPIKIFAENANKVLFGKTEAVVTNTDNPDFKYDKDRGREIPETYYVFTATVSLKKGLNKIKYTVQVGSNSYNDEIQIFNANSSVNGAEYRDILGKKVSFSVFDKALELKFPSGTVLLSPENKLEGEEVKNPLGDIFVDVPLYFGIADRTTGQVTIPGSNMSSKLDLDDNFNYASPLYYVDAGDKEAPGGRDPYEENDDDIRDFKSRNEENLVPSRAGTLSIKYDASIVNAANNILTVFYQSGSGDWQNLGGVVNTGKKVITVPFRGFGYYIVLKNRESFDDVIGHEYARDAMETLFSKGIMVNYRANEFGAYKDISRGEFATMLVKALDLPINDGPYEDEDTPSSPTFKDVNPRRDRWDYEYKYIETAARAGIVRGKEPGYFRPEQPLSRQEAAIMIARALNMKLGTLDASKLALGKMFEDAKDVSYYAAPSVLAVAKAKLMNGEPKDPNAKKPVYRFVPNTNLTRADMAVITIRVMVQLKKLPKQ